MFDHPNVNSSEGRNWKNSFNEIGESDIENLNPRKMVPLVMEQKLIDDPSEFSNEGTYEAQPKFSMPISPKGAVQQI